MRPLFLIFLLTLFPVLAQGADQDAVRRAVESGRYKPLSEILSKAVQAYPGRVLDVELERQHNGMAMYEIKLIDHGGRQHKLYADAVTGALIDRSSEDIDEANLQPLSTILRVLLEKYPGHITDVDLERDDNGRIIYEVEIALLDGRVREIEVDAISGVLLNADREPGVLPKNLQPLPDILDQLKTQYSGLIAEAELESDRRGGYYYKIELKRKNGDELKLHVDAVSGKIIREMDAD